MSPYIVLEGGDGSGKSTQLTRLVGWLEAGGRSVTCVREPGTTPLAEALRSILLEDREPDIDPTAEAMLFSAARRELVTTVVAPALARGDVVVSDRSFVSTLVYQCLAPVDAARRVSRDAFIALTRAAHGEVWPTLVVVLDVSAECGRARLGGRAAPDRIEARGTIWGERVREAFAGLAGDAALAELLGPGRVRVVDATGTPDEVERAVRVAVEDSLAAGEAR